MTLGGEPVLELSLTWPEPEGRGFGRVKGYYRRLSRAWEARWKRETYWSACADLALKREASRPFSRWKCELSGAVRLEDDKFLSVVMMAREVQGDGRALEYRWGDTWRREDGCPVALRELFPNRKGWRREVLKRAEEAAIQAQEQGLYLEPGWERELRTWFSPSRFALAEGAVLLFYPQCTLAAAVEGAVTLTIPLDQT